MVLLTDFGTRDPYVAAMKGVLAARTAVPIIDLTHEIAPFDVWEGAWFLRAALPYWREAVFVCVVDPGVGTARRIVAMRSGTNVLLAPDNGLLTFCAAASEGTAEVVSVENESFFLPNGSATFHGRDRFAPVAAAIANGLAPGDMGPRIDDLIALPYEPPVYEASRVTGTIVSIDRFGNAITDVERARMPFARFRTKDVDRISTTYTGDGAFLIVGSTGCIEISLAGASAAERLQLKRGERVELWKNEESS